MVCGEYDISRESMELLQRYLSNPSKDYALGREEMIRRMRSEFHSSFHDDVEISSFDDLDLSFLQEFKVKSEFKYSQTNISDNVPFWDGFSSISQFYESENIVMAAA